MSLPTYLLFDSIYSLICYEGFNTQSESISINIPIEFECAIKELDKSCSFNSEQWQFYLYRFDPQCDYCNLWNKQQSNMQQITSKSTIANNGHCAEFKCKINFFK